SGPRFPRSGPRLPRRCFDRAVLRCAPIWDGRSLRLASLIGLAGGPVEGAPLGRRAGAVPLLVDRHMPAVLVALAVTVAADAIGADRPDDARKRRGGGLGRRPGRRRRERWRRRGRRRGARLPSGPGSGRGG